MNMNNLLKNLYSLEGGGEESGLDNPINLVSYTSRSFLTSSPSHMSPRVRERSPRNMTSSKTWLLSGLFMSAA